MDYVGNIFRPPSEAYSMLVQITTGCSHNDCTFCAMYKDKSFRIKPWETVKKDLDEALSIPTAKRIFLCDGDALVLSTRRLLQVLQYIQEHGPHVERVGIYGDPISIRHKSQSEIQELADAGLKIVYHGLETGDDELLVKIQKGSTAQDSIEMAEKLRAAGIEHSVIVLLGLAGVEGSERHARKTAEVLTKMDPRYVGALTLTLVPGTPIFEEHAAGRFELPDKFGFLKELRTLLAESSFTRCRFSSNHASNYLPIRADLPEEKEALLSLLDDVIAKADENMLRPEWSRGL